MTYEIVMRGRTDRTRKEYLFGNKAYVDWRYYVNCMILDYMQEYSKNMIESINNLNLNSKIKIINIL